MQENRAIVFNCVHGDVGENGELQKILRDQGVCFTGSKHAASSACQSKKAIADVLEVRARAVANSGCVMSSR